MINWRFYIRNNDIAGDWQEIDEPIGWDGDELVLARSANTEGVENYRSSELDFYDNEFNAKTLIVSGYESKGYDANFDIKIDAYCNGELVDSIVGYLNFVTYQREGNIVKLQFEESSFSRKFRSRIDTIINLDDPNGIDGDPLTPTERKTVRLHSKEIKLFTEESYSEEYDRNTFVYESSGSFPAPPYQYQATEQHVIGGGSGCVTKSSTFYFQLAPDTPTILDDGLITKYNIPNGISTSNNPYAVVNQSGSITVDINLEAAFYVWGLNNLSGSPSNAKRCDCGDEFAENDYLLDHFDFQIEVRIGSQVQANGISSYDYSVCSENFFGDLSGKNESYMSDFEYPGMSQAFSRPFTDSAARLWNKKVRWSNLSYQYNFDNVSQGEDIYIHLICNVNGSYERRLLESRFAYVCEGYIGSNSSISISSNTSQSPSTTEGYLVYEALNKIAESITGRTDAIRSDYFGRTDSVPKSYPETGCEALNLYTNGKNIRNLVDSDGNKYNIFMSFTDLFNDLNQKRCIGWRIERNNGVDYVRIEPIEYFYSNDVFISFSDVSGIREEVAIQRLYNDFEIGYNKWEIENLNGIDEFNTKRTYSIPSRNIKQKLTATTNYVSGGYAIEMTRRMQAATNPTTDWKYDDDNFCISLNRIEVTSDRYSVSSETYQPGEVSERDELYDSVVNVISPETSYNLRFSPAECALFWFKKIAAALVKKDDQRLRFQSGTGNLLLTKTRSQLDECTIIQNSLIENQDITATNSVFLNLSRIALYNPIWISFKVPLNYSEFITIRENSNKKISATCGGEIYEGFLEEIKYKPNREGGVADIKIILSNCYLGEFNSDFNNDFNTGTC